MYAAWLTGPCLFLSVAGLCLVLVCGFVSLSLSLTYLKWVLVWYEHGYRALPPAAFLPKPAAPGCDTGASLCTCT
jgi:hypothetical protein